MAQGIPENMRIYEAARAVPKEAQKPFNNGKFSGTDIAPMWRLKKLTELFGPSGIGWYTEITRMDTLEVDGEIFAIVNINLYIKDAQNESGWSKPIFGTGGNKLLTKTRSGTMTSDEGFKMAYTDAISVACKALGIGADIYFANDKSSKYTEYYTDGGRKPEQPKAPTPSMATPEQLASIAALFDADRITAMLTHYKLHDTAELTQVQADLIIRKRMREIEREESK